MYGCDECGSMLDLTLDEFGDMLCESCRERDEDRETSMKYRVGIVGFLPNGDYIADVTDFATRECAERVARIIRSTGLYANCAVTLVEVGVSVEGVI